MNLPASAGSRPPVTLPPTISAPTPGSVAWPTPPFQKLIAQLRPGQDRDCVLERVDGRSMRGELVAFEPGALSITFQSADLVGPERLDLAAVRSLRLTRPVGLVADESLLSDIGAARKSSRDPKPFSVLFRDGTSMAGETRGFIRDENGVFLFLPESKSALTVRWFIPAGQLLDLQVGPLLGDALAKQDLISREALKLALARQRQIRDERIGDYLKARAIISGDELTRGLLAQKERPQVRLGDLLVEARIITPEVLEEALTAQAANRKRRLGDILVDMGAATPRMIQMALADKLGIPYVNVSEFEIEPAALKRVDAVYANRYQVLPLQLAQGTLVVAVDNPLTIDFLQELRFTAGTTVVTVMADPGELRARIAREYANSHAAADAPVANAEPARASASRGTARDLNDVRIEELALQLSRETQPHVRASKEDPETRVTDNALVRLVNKVIMDAHAQGASDIHVENHSAKGTLRLRFRIDGELKDYLVLPQAYRRALVARIKIMANLDSAEHRRPQDGKISFGRHGALPLELRVAIVPTANDLEDVVLRILGGVGAQPLDQLGFSQRVLKELTLGSARNHGLLLVCGPTGSGKTTTLHSVLKHINRPDQKIWTVEDPIEITQAGLCQVQVNPDLDWTFAAALRSFLRADPDVIMVGEMRDAETARIAVEASLTGHLVFSTLHTNSAAESVVRLLNLGMDPFNFADALIGILSQRLVRRLCPHCRQPHIASDAELAQLAAEYCAGTALEPAAVLEQWRAEHGHHGRLSLYTATGCKDCSGGYKGRAGIYELMMASPQVKELVRRRGTVPQLVETAQADGMRLLRQDAIEKALGGVIDLSSAHAASS